MPLPQTADDLMSVRTAAKSLRMDPRFLRRVINEGRVPFAERVGNRWYVTGRSLEFLREHYSPAKRKAMHSPNSSHLVQAMAEAAAALDPRCVAMRREFFSSTSNSAGAG